MSMNNALFFIRNPSNELIGTLWPKYNEYSDIDTPEEISDINHIYLCPVHGYKANNTWFLYTQKERHWKYSALIEVTEEEINKYIAMHYLNNISFVDFMKLER